MKPSVLRFGLILCGVFWSFSGVLVKELSFLGVTDSFLICSVRSGIGLLFLLPLIWKMFTFMNVAILSGLAEHPEVRAAGVSGREWRLFVYLGAAAVICNTLLLTWAFQHTNAASAVFLHYGGLVLICLVSKRVLNQIPSRLDFFALGLFFVGMGILVHTGFQVHEVAPTVAGIVCGITFALFQLSLAKLSQWDEKIKPPVSLALQCQFVADLGIAVIGAAVALAHRSALPHSYQAWVALAAIGVIAWGLPNVLFIILIRINPLVDSLILSLGDPVFAAIWPMLLGFDAVHASPIIGSAIIFSALLLKAAAPKLMQLRWSQ